MQKKKKNRVIGVSLAALLAASQSVTALPAFADEATTDGYVYGTVDLEYADYYYGELNDVAENATMDLTAADPTADLRTEGMVDAVTSATNMKSTKYGCTYYTQDETSGAVTVGGVCDVNVAIPAELYTAAQEAITNGDACSNQLLNIVSAFTESTDGTVPAEYKVLNGDGTLTAMKDSNEAVTVSDATVAVSTKTAYGDYQLDITEADSTNSVLPTSSNMEGVVLTMSDGTKYAMLHVDNLWLRTGEMAWAVNEGFVVHNINTLKYAQFADTQGKTVTSVKYIVRDGADVTFTCDAYLPVLHDGTVTATNAPAAGGTVSVVTADLPDDYEETISVDGLDITSWAEDGTVTYDATTAKIGSYTANVTDANGVYAPISTKFQLTTDTMPAVYSADSKAIVAADDATADDLSAYLSAISSVSVNGKSYNASGRGAAKIINADGTVNYSATAMNSAVFAEEGDYTLSVTATGYTTPLEFTVSVSYVYGTIDVMPYADYYYGELNTVTPVMSADLTATDATASLRAEGMVDAVTSATNMKSEKYGCTNFTADEDSTNVTVNGLADIHVAIPADIYAAAQEAITAGTECSNQLLNLVSHFTADAEDAEKPAEYKVLYGNGTLSAMKDSNEAVTVSDATVAVSVKTAYGDYQLDITEADSTASVLPTSDNMEGVVLTMSDGTKYAMLHVDNLWLRTGEMAWAVNEGFVVHNINALKYAQFADTQGKTVTSVKYIVRDGADVTFTCEAYLPVLHDGTVTATNAPVAGGTVSIVTADLPDDYAEVVTVEGLDISEWAEDGTLTYDATTASIGKYTATVTDDNGVYASMSTTFELTTDAMPAQYDAENGALVAADDATADEFAAYLSAISSVSVNGTSYNATGRGAATIINSDGTINAEASTRDGDVFAETGTYTLTVTATGYETPLTFDVDITLATLGDVDGNDAIEVSDAFLTLMATTNISAGLDSGLTDEQALAADVDGDGSITVNDAFYVLTYCTNVSAGIETSWDDIIK